MTIAWTCPRDAVAELPTVKTSAEWRDYFAHNAAHLLAIPWEQGMGATPAELAEIVGSLRAWQLGETSDGSHLLAAARNYADKVQDLEFVEAITLFIAEEQRHGESLGRFLDLAGVPRAGADWGDWLFRRCRTLLPSMEIWATPVAMVETHALVYYDAIRQATSCLVLRRICEQILADEVPHIQFQCERLAILHRARPRWLRALTLLLHRAFFTGITLLIWAGHRRALRAGGNTFRGFWRSAWAKMHDAWRAMNPDAYHWQEENLAQTAGA